MRRALAALRSWPAKGLQNHHLASGLALGVVLHIILLMEIAQAIKELEGKEKNIRIERSQSQRLFSENRLSEAVTIISRCHGPASRLFALSGRIKVAW